VHKKDDPRKKQRPEGGVELEVAGRIDWGKAFIGGAVKGIYRKIVSQWSKGGGRSDASSGVERVTVEQEGGGYWPAVGGGNQKKKRIEGPP